MNFGSQFGNWILWYRQPADIRGGHSCGSMPYYLWYRQAADTMTLFFFLHSLWSSCISVSVSWICYYVQSSCNSQLGYWWAADTTFAHSLLCDYVWLTSSCHCILPLHMFLVDLVTLELGIGSPPISLIIALSTGCSIVSTVRRYHLSYHAGKVLALVSAGR